MPSEKFVDLETELSAVDARDETMKAILGAQMTGDAKCIVIAMILKGKREASFNELSKALNAPNGEIAMGSVSLRAAGLNVAPAMVFDKILLPEGIV